MPSQLFTSSGTFIVPSDVSVLTKIYAIGSGAPGNAFGPGGGGAFSGVENYAPVGGSLTITIGIQALAYEDEDSPIVFALGATDASGATNSGTGDIEHYGGDGVGGGGGAGGRLGDGGTADGASGGAGGGGTELHAGDGGDSNADGENYGGGGGIALTTTNAGGAAVYIEWNVPADELAARDYPAGNLAGNDNWTADGHGMAVVDDGGDICVSNQTVEDSAETNYTPLPGTLTSGLTLEFDMKVVFQNGQSLTQELTVFSAADEVVLYCLITLNDNGATDCYMAASNTLIHFTSSPTFTDGVYKHFKLTYNDGIAFAYVDGVKVASVIKTRSVGAATKFQLIFTPASATSINRVFVKHITVDAGPFPPTAGTITTTGTVAINATATGTVTLDGDYLGTVTLSDNKTGSTFAHGTLNFLSAANHSVGTFTITPTIAGTHTISGASSPTLTITSGALVVSAAPTPATSSRSNGCIDGIILRVV